MEDIQLEKIVNEVDKNKIVLNKNSKEYKIGHGLGFGKGFIAAAIIITLSLVSIPYFSKKDDHNQYRIVTPPQYRIEKKQPTNIKEMFPEMHAYNIEDAINSNYKNMT